MSEATKHVLLTVEDPYASPARQLVEAMWVDVEKRYSDEIGPCALDPAEVAGDGCVFLIARLEGEPVGCGALRRVEPEVAEVKRVYVTPGARGRRIAGRILAELERQAREMGFTTLRLETGTPQPEAIRLYEREGYHRIPSFGKYADDPRTVCFEKKLL